ncbi:MAG: CDP-alcohol phosphatidyltransferase family protein [Chloroflexota bacterium]
MNRSPTEQQGITLSDLMRQRMNGITSAMGIALHKIGFHPDVVTFMGWGLVIVGSVFIAQGEFLIGAIWYMLALPFDALDGAVARAMQRTSQFGAMLDSTLDRYADGFIFVAFSYYFAVQAQFDLFVVAQIALIGSFLVSYARARAEGLGVDCKVGWFTRMERLAVILLMSFFPVLLTIGIWLLAIGTNITAMQRIWYVYQTLNNRGE